ncbi:MAG: hypothetical protein ACREV1_06635 [Gammaproteobacteria bacterium]
MNTKTLKGMGVAASLLIGIGAASPALATVTPPQILGAAPNSIDVWTFGCPAGTVSAIARVHDTPVVFNAAALMQVVLGEDGLPTVQATDFAEGGAPSPAVVVADGPGLYAMAFKKTAVGVDSYLGEAVCVTAAGIFHPFLTKRINQ